MSRGRVSGSIVIDNPSGSRTFLLYCTNRCATTSQRTHNGDLDKTGSFFVWRVNIRSRQVRPYRTDDLHQ